MLREYQQWAIDATWDYFRTKTGNPIIVMPTGTGKSHVIAGLVKSMCYAFPATRVMMLTHVKELIVQNFNKFLESWPNAPVGIYSAGLKQKDSFKPITFAGIGSVAGKEVLFGHIDILFIDECDLVSTKEKTMYRKFIAALMVKNPLLKVIGLTATAWRTGTGSLIEGDDPLFTDIAVDMSGVEPFNWFLDQGYLCPLISKPTRLQVDTSNLHLRGGEFIDAEVQLLVDKPEITRAALQEAMEVGQDRHKWLIFASGIEHAKNIALELCTMGVHCEAVYTGMENRDKVIDDYRRGSLRAIVNNNILTTGFDAPWTDLIVCLRPSASSRLWVQMLGRGDRPYYADGFDLSTQEGRLLAIANSPKHNCMVLDYAKNIERLGPINDPVIPRKKGKGGPAPAPFKTCPCCENYNHASARYCGGKPIDHPQFDKDRGCGTEFIFDIKIKVEASSKDLIKQTELPVVETFRVEHVTYALHKKIGAPPMLRATYYSNISAFSDYVCIEHPKDSFANKKARDWWRERSQYGRSSVPTDVDDALDLAASLKVPTHIDVWTNTKYPQIKRYCFDGTRFGTEEVSDPAALKIPGVDTKVERAHNKPADYVPDLDAKGDTSPIMEDDIPF